MIISSNFTETRAWPPQTSKNNKKQSGGKG